MGNWIQDLRKKLRGQGRSILLEEADAPGVSGLFRLFGAPRLQVDKVKLDTSERRLAGLFKLAPEAFRGPTEDKAQFLRRLAKEIHSHGKTVRVEWIGMLQGVKVGHQFYPLIELEAVAKRARQAARAKLRASTTRGQRSKSVDFVSTLPRRLELTGELPSGEQVHAEFWLEGSQRRFRIGVKLKTPAKNLLLDGVYHPELSALQFHDPLILLSSHDQAASQKTMPLVRGLAFYVRYEFGPHLQQAVRARCPRVLYGDISGTPQGLAFKLRSTPFELRFGEVLIDEASLWLESRWSDESGSKECLAQLKGVWRAGMQRLEVWTTLPPDQGVACWSTPLASLEMDSPASEDEDEPGLEDLEAWRETGFSISVPDLSALAPLIGNWNGWWQGPPRLAVLLQRAQPLTLVHAELGTDLVTQAVSDVALRLRGGPLRCPELQDFELGPVVFDWSIGHPWNGSQRSALAQVSVLGKHAGFELPGYFHSQDFTLVLHGRELRENTALAQACGVREELWERIAAEVDQLRVSVNLFEPAIELWAATHDGQEVLLLKRPE